MVRSWPFAWLSSVRFYNEDSRPLFWELSSNLFKEFYARFVEFVIYYWLYNGSIEDIDLSPEISEFADCKIESGTGVYL